MSTDIPVIDLFAGAGGLGEGFAQVPPFKVKLSVEMNAQACDTLRVRAVFRHLRDQDAIHVYREWLETAQGRPRPANLFEKAPRAAADADNEVLCHRLGSDDETELFDRIRKATSGRDAWVLVGGPPCQAYSVIGRSRNKAIKGYRPEDDERNFLYREYLKILAELAPPVFVMENVKGMLSARVNGSRVFERIVEDLEKPAEAIIGSQNGPRYRLHTLGPQRTLTPSASDFVLRTEDYGLPQARHRVIIVGVREDIDVAPRPLRPAAEPPHIQDALRGLPPLRSRLSRGDSFDAWQEAVTSGLRMLLEREVEFFRTVECGSELFAELQSVASLLKDTPISAVGAPVSSRERLPPAESPMWAAGLLDDLVLQHESRSHMVPDLIRYVFAAVYARVMGRSPKLPEFPRSLQPAHRNRETGHFSDRFRVQLADRPSTTITSHIAKDGHYFIHFDPLQCRSLTVREAARLQTFPDDYLFAGNRTEQYRQVGNAVPPQLARMIADAMLPLLQ